MSFDPAGRPRLVEVAADAPLSYTLTYVLPERLYGRAEIGKRLLVPLGGRRVTGYLVGLEPKGPPPAGLKEVIEVLDAEPLFSPELLALFRFASRYYLCPLAEVIKTALPPGINVSTRRVLQLTADGRLALAETQAAGATAAAGSGRAALAADEVALLARLEEEGGIEAARVLKLRSPKATRAMVGRLLRRGLLETTLTAPGPRVKPRTEHGITRPRELTAEERARLQKRAPIQHRLWEELRECGTLAASELRDRYRDPGRLMRALVAAGIAEAVAVPVERDPFALALPAPPAPERLMPEQEEAVTAIAAAVAARSFSPFLLEGVTGSGKTEVYLRVIQAALALDLGAIVLAPEIALTPQLVSRFRSRFPDEKIAVLHSGLGPGERHDQWWLIRRGAARIVIGARSAVFSPVSRLGVIVVDEEQDPAYKQDHGFMYNGRDLALKRGQEEKATVVLGSATPSLESALHGRRGEFQRRTLRQRVDGRPLATVEVVDLRAEAAEADRRDRHLALAEKVRERDRLVAERLFSPILMAELKQTLQRKEQAIIFLNRRGASSFLLCFDCGRRFTCPNCDVSLVHHRAPSRAADRSHGEPAAGGYLLCHYCGYHTPEPDLCPTCRGVRVFPFGAGTEQIEKELAARFPGARLLRLDSDSMTGRESWFRCLDRAHRREVDILVGTQMVAKGHDLPGVTLVGVLLADLSLELPDFRAAERTFQLLTQVAGRAGRGDAPGKVIVQTFRPEHYAVKLAVAQDFEGFYAEETRRREALKFPPFARLANLRLAGLDPAKVKEAAIKLGRAARRQARLKSFAGRVTILGPVPAPIGKLRGKYRYLMLVKAETPTEMSAFLAELSAAAGDKAALGPVELEIDRDPVNMM
jgi:primosomal protein N' (replication factor Y)